MPIEISSVTLVALDTRSVPLELVVLPPSATALASARNRTEPAIPRWSPEVPARAIAVLLGLDAVARCGVVNAAENEIEPGRSAVRRTAISWSGALAITSRRYRTPPAV